MTSTSTSAPSRPPAPSRVRRRAASVLAGSLLAGAAVLASTAGPIPPAHAADELRERIQFCDATACLVAWRVVDSDGDGVSDADEWVAGSDPHDPRSTPSMARITEVLAARELPTFENGFAAMVVMPAELVEQRQKAVGEGRLAAFGFDGFEGFPIEARKDTLSRLGISTDLMAEHGIDLGRGAFTLGIEVPGKDDDGLPPIRVGGVDITTISAGHGGSDKDHGDADAPASDHEPADDDGGHDHTPPKGEDDPVPLPNLNLGEPVGTSKVLGITFTHYEDGTIIGSGLGQRTYYWPTGETQTFPDKKNKYDNPDAEDATVIDPAAFEQWVRVAGAVERTAEGWQAPGTDAEVPEPRGVALIALIDADLAIDAAIVLDEPRITGAQPEVDPNHPNPFVAAPDGGPRGSGGCEAGYCG